MDVDADVGVDVGMGVGEPAEESPVAPAPGAGRIIAVLAGATFLAASNTFALGPFFAVAAPELKTTVPLLGQATTVMLIFSALVGLIIAPLADHFGHRRVMTFGMLTLILSAIGTGLARSYPQLLLVQVFTGLSAAILFGMPLAIAGIHFSGDTQRRAVSWTVSAMGMAGVLGVTTLTSIGGWFGWRWAFVALTIGGLVGLVFVLLALPRDRSSAGHRFPMSSLIDSYRPLLRHRTTARLLGGSAGRSVCWIGMWTYLGAFLVEAHGMSVQQTGIVFMTGGLGFFSGSLLGGRLRRFDGRRLFAGTSLIVGLFVGLVYVLPSGVAPIVALLVGSSVASAIGWVGLTNVLVNETPASPATTMVLNGSILNLGSALGGAVGGALLSLGGYAAIGVGLPLFAWIAALLVWQRRQQVVSQTPLGSP